MLIKWIIIIPRYLACDYITIAVSKRHCSQCQYKVQDGHITTSLLYHSHKFNHYYKIPYHPYCVILVNIYPQYLKTHKHCINFIQLHVLLFNSLPVLGLNPVPTLVTPVVLETDAVTVTAMTGTCNPGDSLVTVAREITHEWGFGTAIINSFWGILFVCVCICMCPWYMNAVVSP